MKKFLCLAAAALAAVTLFCGCSKSQNVDYSTYVSEKRENIYSYADDDLNFTVYYGVREQPFEADGVRGELFRFAEARVKFTKTPSEVLIDIDGAGGEMNYNAVECNFSLNFPDPQFGGDALDVILTVDGRQRKINVQSVLYEGVMECDRALDCVKEYAKDLFSSLTERGVFNAEIFVRLLFDDGCYYYVGVCDRQHNIHAYLVDGVRGKIIAEKKLSK